MVLSSHSENPNSLARRCNANQKTLNNQINGETAVSLSTILLVLEALPDVSTEWLLRGKGDMLISEGQSGNQVTSNSHNVTTNSHNETHVNTSLSVSSLLDIPKDVISEALGHSHGSTVTGIYIRYSLDKIDEANRRVIDHTAGK